MTAVDERTAFRDRLIVAIQGAVYADHHGAAMLADVLIDTQVVADPEQLRELQERVDVAEPYAEQLQNALNDARAGHYCDRCEAWHAWKHQDER